MFWNSKSSRIVTAAVATTILCAASARAQEAWMVVTHQVEDFERWKEVFDAALAFRQSAGEVASYTRHNPLDQNTVTVWFEWKTMEQAKAWAADPALANGMRAAGVVSPPVFTFREVGALN